MEKTPLVSIVLPVHNGERYLRESIDSILQQTFTDWELVVVNDRSTDGSVAIIMEYCEHDPRIRMISNDLGGKLPGTLNYGFRATRGELLAWTSDDNRYRPDALEVLVACFQTTPSVDFIYSDFTIIDGNGKVTRPYTVVEPEQLVLEEHMIACFMYRRRVYEGVGDYAIDLYLAEDYDYYLRVLAGGFTMYALHQDLYEYRLHEASLTGGYKEQAFASAEQALQRYMVNREHLTSGERARIYIHMASLASWRGDKRAAAGYSMQAARLDPAQMLSKGVDFARRKLTKQS